METILMIFLSEMSKSKHIFFEMREREMFGPELTNPEGSYCSHCGFNWAQLHSQEDMDYCPMCRTDSYLEPSKPGDSFIYSAITGEVINVRTKQVVPNNPLPVYLTTSKGFDWKAFEKDQYEWQAKQIRALNIYTELYDKGDRMGATKAYFEILTNESGVTDTES
jgi:hypothetical protein